MLQTESQAGALISAAAMFHLCDGCTRLLDQISSSLVQSPKEAKAWAVTRPKTSLNPTCLETLTGTVLHGEY